ncbi:MAG: amidohydrolase family protein [Gemmatimonadales bacterium]|nr:amidohydrolase family protein [Gemmatimonadales bacterium]
MPRSRVGPLLLAILIAGPLVAQERPIAFVGGRVIPVSGEEIANGTVIIHRGRITAVGSSGSVTIPADAERRDVTGRVLMPGLVDSHSHVGEVAGADGSAPIQGDVRALDAINVRAASIKKARAGGITTVNVMPGSGHLMSGQTAYLKLRDGNTINDLLLCSDPERGICGGMKMANGTNPRRAAPFPGTRAKAAALVRAKFIAAREYRAKLAAAGNDAAKRPPRDLEMEALVEVLDGKRVVHHHTHRHDDILTVLRLKEEFGFRVVLHHVSEGWKVAREIAAAGVPSSVIVIDAPGGKLEAMDLSFDTGRAIDEAGGEVGFHTDDGITDSRVFLRSAALAVRAGMSREKALAGVTIANARMLDMGDRVGTLEPGKDADLVVLSGDPLSVYTLVQETWIEGRLLFDRANPEHRLFAEGGLGAGDDSLIHVHADMEGHN